MDLKLRIGTKREYDDNNYFNAHYVCSALGEEVDWGSWHLSEMFPDLIDQVKEIIPSNALKFITERTVEEDVIKKIDDLKETEDWKFDTDMVDFIIKCIRNKYDLDLVKTELFNTGV